MVISLIIVLFRVLEWIIIIDCVLSFVPSDSLYSVRQAIGNITEPILAPFRAIQERIAPGFMIDFSPVIALIVIQIIERLIIALFLR
ncbi:YggT family protein [Clostridium hydrogenum]|uniref:YggT family protein n=1 Tax=Clostridium hydrogenum TaxID=2855764 RepID=UPI001F1A4C90|nr:YggT family protein [Clostridium hydrogenum]